MRKRLTILAASASLVLLAAPGVGAEVVVGEPPVGWTTIRKDCGNAASPTSGWEVAPQFGPVATGVGEGSIKLTAGISDMEGFHKSFPADSAEDPAFGDIASLAADVYEPAGGRFAFRITVHTDAGARALVWEPTTDGAGFSAAIPQLNLHQWTIYDADGIGTSFGTTTLEGYQTAHPDASFEVGVVSWGCAAASTVYVNTLNMLINGVGYSYDFEPLATDMAITASKSTMTFGGQVTVSGNASYEVSGNPLAVGVRLIAKPGDRLPYEVGALTTGSDGFAQLIDEPMFTTRYQWELFGAGDHGSCVSANWKVVVKARVTASLVDATVKEGEKIKVTGKVTPDWGSRVVTLWRETSTGRVKLGTTSTRSDLTYKVVSSALTTTNTATWKVFTSVPATEDNAAGRSPTLNVEIN